MERALGILPDNIINFGLLHWFLVENALFCCLQHYIQIDLWDYDTLNRDDFMGRIQIPLAFLTEDTTACWYPLGRSSAKDNICGEVFLELTLKASQVWINILWVVMGTVTLKMILMLIRIVITAGQWTTSGQDDHLSRQTFGLQSSWPDMLISNRKKKIFTPVHFKRTSIFFNLWMPKGHFTKLSLWGWDMQMNHSLDVDYLQFQNQKI